MRKLNAVFCGRKPIVRLIVSQSKIKIMFGKSHSADFFYQP